MNVKKAVSGGGPVLVRGPSVLLVVWGLVCDVSLSWGDLYTKCSYFCVLYIMQRVLNFVVLYMQRILIIWCFVYYVCLLFRA